MIMDVQPTNITLTEPLPFVYTVDSITETCNLVNGQPSISVTQGGTSPYVYLWDDLSAQTTQYQQIYLRGCM